MTLGYDTIYGFQDIKDDEIIGLKSTSIKFGMGTILFLYACYSFYLITLLVSGYLIELNYISIIFFIIALYQMFYYQLQKLKIKNSSSCLKIFKSNNFLGLIVFLGLLIGKV